MCSTQVCSNSPLYGGITIKKRVKLDWSLPVEQSNFKPNIAQFQHYLVDNGFMKSTIDSYLICAEKYLEFAKTGSPSKGMAENFRATLHVRKLSRSSINNYCSAIKNYHAMLGEQISFPYLRLKETIPYYFSQDDVLRIFGVINNFKHYAMLSTLFYGCLRASEFCALNIEDIDLNALAIRVRAGKGGREGIAIINDQCAVTLKKYFEIRPKMEIKNESPLFFTDYGNRWDRKIVYHIFEHYKKKAGIHKRGGLHVFSRHTPATLMIANGCDIRIVKEVLRHRDIRTTLRYAHVSDKTKREKYEKYLTL